MRCRPTDPSGDVLPVLSPGDLLTGSEALAAGLADHLKLHYADWWEYDSRGNEIFDMIAASRYTAQDADALSSYLAAYIQEFPGVRSVSDISASFSGRTFNFSAAVHPEEGNSQVPVTFTA